jgi:hypothetical protein
MAGEINTVNRFGVGLRGENVIVMKFGARLSVEDAYNLAAYLVAMAEAIEESKVRGDADMSDAHTFDEWLNAVRAT